MTDKPLHVRVAEALGWTECGPFEADGIYDYENWVGESPVLDEKSLSGFVHGFVPRYDTDWSATGPLVEKYQVWLNPCAHDGRETHWVAMSTLDDFDADVEAPTPLGAVCALILALHEAGKLPKEDGKA